MTDKQYQLHLTAHHEAGHAVIAMMMGHTVTSVTIRPGRQAEYAGRVKLKKKRTHLSYNSFIAYAGPWSEARAEWDLVTDGSPIDEMDGILSFADYLSSALEDNPDDVANFEVCPDAEYRKPQYEQILEKNWAGIKAVAELLLDAPVRGERLARLNVVLRQG